MSAREATRNHRRHLRRPPPGNIAPSPSNCRGTAPLRPRPARSIRLGNLWFFFLFAFPNLALTQSIESAIRSADLLIDTLPDDLEVKLELFTLFDKFAKPAAIFITTGTIPIDDLAEITFSPERCVAVHLAPLDHNQYAFELLPGARTSRRDNRSVL